MLSTTMLVATVAGYGRRVHADQICDQQGSTTTYFCQGTSSDAQDLIDIDNVQVVTGDPFSVSTIISYAIAITGDGALSYTDYNGATLSSDVDNAFYIKSNEDDGSTPGSVTVVSNGTFNGDFQSYNFGTGNLSITLNAGGSVSGGGWGIYADNRGSSSYVTVNGDVTADIGVFGEAGTGVYVNNDGSGPLEVTIGAYGSVSAEGYGVNARATSGPITINTYGDVTGKNDAAINAYSYAGTDITVTTGANATVSGVTGINVYNKGYGEVAVSVSGDVTGTDGNAIGVTNRRGTDIAVTVGAVSTVKSSSDADGIEVDNEGSGSINVTVYGTVNGGEIGVEAVTLSGTDVTVTTGQGSTVSGSYAGINVTNGGSGTVIITANGDVTGQTGIGVSNYTGNNAQISVGAGSTVTATSSSNFAVNVEHGGADITVAGDLDGSRGIQFDQAKAYANTLTIGTTADITGTVLAGPGTNDALLLSGPGQGEFNLSDIDTGAGTQQYRNFESFEMESGNWTFTGGTSMPLTVMGGVLRGTGTFGDLDIVGATLAPGNSIGTMRVNGAFTLSGGAVYEVEVNAEGQSDRVVVKGTVNLTGSTLRVLAANGDYKQSTDYTIIDNDGGDAVQGRFAKIENDLAFLKPSVDYGGGDGNDVVLTLTRYHGKHNGGGASFCSVATSPNQCHVAKALDQFPTTNPLFLSVLFQSAEGAREAFNALSGEVHATVAGTLVEDSRYAREAVLGRMTQASHVGGALGSGGPQVASRRAAYDAGAMRLGGNFISEEMAAEPAAQPLAFWTQGYGARGTFDGDGNAATADRNLGGFISGMDASVGGSWRAGVATGASFSDVSVDERYSGANTKTYHLGGYVNGDLGGFALRGGGLWAWSEIETARAVVFPGFFERQKADYDADTGQLFGEVAYATQVGGIELEPFAGLAYVSVESSGFREKGGAQASLRTSGIDQDVGYTTVGLRAATTMMWGGMAVTPHIEAAWLHAFDDVTPGASLVFATTGIGFDVDGVPLAEDAALLDAGVDFALSDRLSAGVSYQGQYADSLEDNAVKGRLTWLFN
ncbi:autotransporter outer membrane beta-barrel domain-containing protein [Methyloceanibacter caenitepidi]|nr:autotransporter domain-containing protein [Methyloceanibacter caenitepidi]